MVAHAALPPPLGTSSSAETAVPDDIGKFLFFRDTRGRTQVHKSECPSLGTPGVKDCGCRVGLAAGTIDSMIGKLRAFFNSLGRVHAYSPLDPRSNPCSSTFVKNWLKSAYKEQRLARVLRHRGVRCTCVGGRLLGQLQHGLLHSRGGELGQVQRTAGLWLPDRPLSKATVHPEISLLYQPYLL